ncbi:enoyl-CoA hydratase/isomerase family protein [Streptomyces mirabilis]|uniref:enoyl-CoA hydratase/isomerase family protein n=1 Tax=Streptomyces mirabilis TaxID=68239 RepID=UPI0036C59C6A
MSDSTRFTVTRPSDTLWRVKFDNPPINLIDDVMMRELMDLLTEIETDAKLTAVVFESANEDFFLAHYDITGDPEQVQAMTPGPTGMHPWLDILVRLSRLPVVTISAIRGRARGAGSEFALASDIRFASREKAVLGQFEVGLGAVPGGGPSSRLPRLVGRGRALEILLGADDFPGDLAERYGYVNRAVPDSEFEDFVSRFAERVAKFDRRAIATVKEFVNDASLPADEEFPPQLDAFWVSAGRPETGFRGAQLFSLGLQQHSDVELNLGSYIGTIEPPQ